MTASLARALDSVLQFSAAEHMFLGKRHQLGKPDSMRSPDLSGVRIVDR